MLNLPQYYYTPVFFKEEKITFELINRKYLEDLKVNAAFVEFIRSKKGETRIFDFHERIKEFDSKSHKDASLESLGIKVVVPNDSILMAGDADDYFFSPWTVTDRYFYPHGFRHIGSSRHALLYSAQLKGVGRNNLTHRGDYIHAWGGFSLGAATEGMLANIYIDKVTPLGALPIWAIARYTNLDIPYDPSTPCLSIRDSRTYRLAHFEPHSPKASELNEVLTSHVEKHLGTTDSVLVKRKILEQYMSYLQHGINPRSAPIPENMLFDGRAIDTEDYEIFVTQSPVITLGINLIDFITEEELYKLKPDEVYELLLKHDLPVSCDNLVRTFCAWNIHAYIMDELLQGKASSFQEILENFKTGLTQQLNDQNIIKFFLAFLHDPNPGLALDFRFRNLSAEMKAILQNLHLCLECRAEKAEGRLTYYISFTQDKNAKSLRAVLGKVLALTELNKEVSNGVEDCLLNFDNMARIIR